MKNFNVIGVDKTRQHSHQTLVATGDVNKFSGEDIFTDTSLLICLYKFLAITVYIIMRWTMPIWRIHKKFK